LPSPGGVSVESPIDTPVELHLTVSQGVDVNNEKKTEHFDMRNIFMCRHIQESQTMRNSPVF